MTHDHAHPHAHHAHAANSPLRALLVALAVTLGVCVVEVAGGYASGSLALVADAVHMLSDSAGLIVAVTGVLITRRSATLSATYGFSRAEVLTALINATLVLAATVWILVGAMAKLREPTPVESDTMVVIALIGLAANAVSAVILHRARGSSMNVEGAFLHVIADLLGSVVVLAAGAVIALTGFHRADVVASLVIAAMVAPRAWQLVSRSARVLMEQVPHGFDPRTAHTALSAIDGVIEVHDLHVWSLDGANIVVSAHIVTDGRIDHAVLLDNAQRRLADLGVAHPTIQVERPEHAAHEYIC